MAYMYKENRLVLAFTAVSPFAHQHMQIPSYNKEIRYGLSTQDAKNSGSLGFCTFKASRRQMLHNLNLLPQHTSALAW